MSFVPITDASENVRRIDTFQRTEGAELVDVQAVAIVNPATGDAAAPDSSGRVPVTGSLSISNFPATQAISAAALPLPSGAATETTLAAIDFDLGQPTTAAAAADGTGDYGVIAGIKRLALGMAAALTNWTTLLARVPVNGQATMAASLPVVLASNQTVVPTVENALLLTGAAAQTAVVNNILEAASGAAGTDLPNFRTMAVQVLSTGTAGTFIFEQSMDGTNWAALPVFNAALVTGVPITAAITATVSQIIYTFPLRARFVRLRIATTITGGTIQAISRVSSEPWTPTAQLVASNVAANLSATVSGTVTANQGTMAALPAGANAIGDVGIQARANATGAGTPFNYASPATSAGIQVKATAGRILSISLTNTSAALRFVKFFNVATLPTMGTTPAAYEYAIPAGGSINLEPPAGIAHATGIFLAVTTAAGLTNNTTTTVANDVVGFLTFA